MSFPRFALALAIALLPVVAAHAQEPSTPAQPRSLQLQYEATPPGRTAYPPVVPATSPLRRTAPVESRLTCADYSLAYFARHPAMAEVCNVDLDANKRLEATAHPCAAEGEASPTAAE